MTVDEMIRRIQYEIRLAKPDAALLDSVVLYDLNQVLDDLTATFCFPELEASDSVSFDCPDEYDEEEGLVYLQADLPTNYHHDLYEAYNVTAQQAVKIHPNLKSLYKYYEDGERKGGYIGNVAVQGAVLWALPAAGEDMDEEIISIRFYEQADDLELAGAGPACVPAHLHLGLLVSGVLRNRLTLFNGDMAAVHDKRYLEAEASLKGFVKTPSRQTPYIKRYARYF